MASRMAWTTSSWNARGRYPRCAGGTSRRGARRPRRRAPCGRRRYADSRWGWGRSGCGSWAGQRGKADILRADRPDDIIRAIARDCEDRARIAKLTRLREMCFNSCLSRAVSLSGRALPSHGRGRWFDPSTAHQESTTYDRVASRKLDSDGFCAIVAPSFWVREGFNHRSHRDAETGPTTHHFPHPEVRRNAPCPSPS